MDKQDKSGEPRTCVEYLERDGDKDDYKTFWKVLKTKDWDMDLANDAGKTPLTYCIPLNLTEKAWGILEFFADPNLQNKDGKTPLHIAVDENKKEFQFLLLLFGADPTIEDNEQRKPFEGKEEDLENFTNILKEYKETFMFLTRKRRKQLRIIFNAIDQGGAKAIDEGSLARYYTEIYPGDNTFEMKAQEDAHLFMEQVVKDKIDPTEKESITFEDYFIAMLKIAKHKGIDKIDEFIKGYKMKIEADKRKAREEYLAKKQKEEM